MQINNQKIIYKILENSVLCLHWYFTGITDDF